MARLPTKRDPRSLWRLTSLWFGCAALTLMVITAALASQAQAAMQNPAATSETPHTSVYNIRGFLPDLRFTLASAEQPVVTEAAFKDKVVILFFGYASCPDICPITLAQLSQVVGKLSNAADQVQIIFVSVDPHRDTPALLHDYVSAFDGNAVGLTGTTRQIAALAKRYRVSYQAEKPADANTRNYLVTHARGIYFFDRRGKARYLASDGESMETLTRIVQGLLLEDAE